MCVWVSVGGERQEVRKLLQVVLKNKAQGHTQVMGQRFLIFSLWYKHSFSLFLIFLCDSRNRIIFPRQSQFSIQVFDALTYFTSL